MNHNKRQQQINELILKDTDKVAILHNYFVNSFEGSFFSADYHYNAFIEQIVYQRKQQSITTTIIANHLGISLDIYLKFEEGKQRLSAKLIVKLMDFLSVELWELTGGKDPNAPILAKIEELQTMVEGEKLKREKLESENKELKNRVTLLEKQGK